MLATNYAQGSLSNCVLALNVDQWEFMADFCQLCEQVAANEFEREREPSAVETETRRERTERTNDRKWALDRDREYKQHSSCTLEPFGSCIDSNRRSLFLSPSLTELCKHSTGLEAAGLSVDNGRRVNQWPLPRRPRRQRRQPSHTSSLHLALLGGARWPARGRPRLLSFKAVARQNLGPATCRAIDRAISASWR